MQFSYQTSVFNDFYVPHILHIQNLQSTFETRLGFTFLQKTPTKSAGFLNPRTKRQMWFFRRFPVELCFVWREEDFIVWNVHMKTPTTSSLGSSKSRRAAWVSGGAPTSRLITVSNYSLKQFALIMPLIFEPSGLCKKGGRQPVTTSKHWEFKQNLNFDLVFRAPSKHSKLTIILQVRVVLH